MREFRLPDGMAAKWHRLMDTLARTAGAGAARVSHVGPDGLTVLAVGGGGAPWKAGDVSPLAGSGSYCESVAASGDRLLVGDPDEDLTWRLLNPAWRENPDRAAGMRSYLGLPVRLARGVVFGVVCLMDGGVGRFGEADKELLAAFRDMLEADLEVLRLGAEAAAFADDPSLGALAVDAGLGVRTASRRFRELWRLKDAEAAGESLRELLGAMAGRAAEGQAVTQHMLSLAEHPDAAPEAGEVALADGRSLEGRSRPVADAAGNVWGRIWLFADATDYLNADGSLRDLSLTDPVTGLATREHFEAMGRQEVSRAKRYGMTLSLVLMHLDGLERVAAEHGQGAVDDLLATVASRGAAVVRNLDVFARVGRHRFALLLPETGREGAEAMAGRLAGLVAEGGFEAGGEAVYAAARTGVACFTRELNTLDSLVSLAEVSLGAG